MHNNNAMKLKDVLQGQTKSTQTLDSNTLSSSFRASSSFNDFLSAAEAHEEVEEEGGYAANKAVAFHSWFLTSSENRSISEAILQFKNFKRFVYSS